MIKNAKIGKEIVVMAANKIGVLADISSAIADHGKSITAVTAMAISDVAMLQMLTDDNLRVKDILKAKNYDVSEREVVVVELENKPGALKLVTKKLADQNINLSYLYGSTCTGGCPAIIIFSSGDNEKAVVTLKK
ncbi:MAG: hypothetical protein KAU58_00460 [Candidatus Omnitrophica bacterium]|nr:hypothetical protein [Candidatus Omnitrophota bacterium]